MNSAGFNFVASEAGSTARNFPRREVGETFFGLAVLQLPAWIYDKPFYSLVQEERIQCRRARCVQNQQPATETIPQVERKKARKSRHRQARLLPNDLSEIRPLEGVESREAQTESYLREMRCGLPARRSPFELPESLRRSAFGRSNFVSRLSSPGTPGANMIWAVSVSSALFFLLGFRYPRLVSLNS